MNIKVWKFNNKSIEEKSKLFALLQRPQDGENEESYKIVEYGL